MPNLPPVNNMMIVIGTRCAECNGAGYHSPAHGCGTCGATGVVNKKSIPLTELAGLIKTIIDQGNEAG